MAQYAKDQPAGFSNSIERVALVGAGGQIGRIITKHLLKNGKHTITAVVRKNSTSPLADGISVAKVDYDNENELVKALTGQQFLIIALAATAPEDVEPKIVKAAAKAGVAWILPYSYTDVLQNKSFDANSLVGPKIASTAKLIEDLGVSSYVISATSLWYEYALVMGTQFYGFDIANKQVEFIDDGSTKINTITWEQSGRAITSLLSLKELPEDENDKSPTISHWRNDILFVSSFLVSQRDIFASLNRVMGIQESDWEIKSEPSKERHARGFNELRAGNHMGFPTALYTRAFFPSGEGNYEDKHGLANDVLGLPKEDLDEATKTAVKMVRDKWQPSQHQILAKEY